MLVSGQVPLVGLFEWLQVLEANRRSVDLRLRRHGDSGRLRLVRGRIADARCGGESGDAVAARLLTWIDAHFEQQRSLDESPGAVTRANYDLMIDALAAASDLPAIDPAWRVTGDLVVTPPVELLQLAELNRRRCTILFHDDVEATVRFDGGRVVEARAGDAVNEQAVYAVIGARFGTFEIAPLEAAPETGFAGSVQELLVEGVRRSDEERFLRGEPVPDPDPTESQLMTELDESALSPTVRLAMARRYQPRGLATPAPVLVRLADDPDEDVREAARESIAHLPAKVKRALIEDADLPAVVREVLAPDADADEADEDLPPDEEYPVGIHGRIRQLSMADKLFLARRGTRNERLILMRHPSRRIAVAALESPRTSDQDIEIIAASSSANSEVLAAIARDEHHNHKYSVARSLVFNAKTPSEIGRRLVARLRERDLRVAWRDTNLSESVRAAVRKRIRALEVKRRF